MTVLGLDFSIGALWWLAAALLLVIAELLAPGFFLIFLGIAAAATGVVTLAAPGLPVVVQALVFAALTAAIYTVGRRWYRGSDKSSADPLLNDRTARLIGSVVVAVEPVDATRGRVKVGDGVWSARGVPAAVGDRLRVTASDGAVLIVARVDS